MPKSNVAKCFSWMPSMTLQPNVQLDNILRIFTSPKWDGKIATFWSSFEGPLVEQFDMLGSGKHWQLPVPFLLDGPPILNGVDGQMAAVARNNCITLQFRRALLSLDLIRIPGRFPYTRVTSVGQYWR